MVSGDECHDEPAEDQCKIRREMAGEKHHFDVERVSGAGTAQEFADVGGGGFEHDDHAGVTVGTTVRRLRGWRP